MYSGKFYKFEATEHKTSSASSQHSSLVNYYSTDVTKNSASVSQELRGNHNIGSVGE
jgi:hypothetical protein